MSAAPAPAVEAILAELAALARPGGVEGMARYGIRAPKVLGVAAPELRALARRLGKSHDLALSLWGTGVHDARILATLVEDPHRVTRRQAAQWALDLDNWAICDALCNNLLVFAADRWETAVRWARRDEEYVKRAAFSLMANLAVHDREAADGAFLELLPAIRKASADPRKPVAKSVNWALRQIGKRNAALNAAAIATADEIRVAAPGPLARWIAADALRELRSEPVRQRLERKA